MWPPKSSLGCRLRALLLVLAKAICLFLRPFRLRHSSGHVSQKLDSEARERPEPPSLQGHVPNLILCGFVSLQRRLQRSRGGLSDLVGKRGAGWFFWGMCVWLCHVCPFPSSLTCRGESRHSQAGMGHHALRRPGTHSPSGSGSWVPHKTTVLPLGWPCPSPALEPCGHCHLQTSVELPILIHCGPDSCLV